MPESKSGKSRRYAQCSDTLLLPFVSTPEMVHMGLQRLQARDWLQPCERLPAYLHNKLRARRQWGARVHAALPGSEPAQRELCDLLRRHLLQDHGRHYSASMGSLRWRAPGAELRWPLRGAEPLWCASQWVADDLCILAPGRDGYELVAASLSAPSYWRLEEKIGRPLSRIHGPVPGFAAKIGDRVARFFDHLLEDYPVWRSNWSVVGSPELLQRGAAGGAADGLYLRVERQSLRRLPQTGAVVFTIRVMIDPLDDLLAIPGAVAALRRAVGLLSPAEARYKSLAPLLPALDVFFAGAGYRGSAAPAGEGAEQSPR